jgi:hypothetical protein
MSEFFKFKKKPPRKPRVSDENNLYGEGWFAQHTGDDRYTLGWDGGELVSKMLEVEISKEEFERLRTDPDSFYEIQFEHDPYR